MNASARWPHGLVQVKDVLEQIAAGAKRLEDVVDCESAEPSDGESLDEQTADDISVRTTEEDDDDEGDLSATRERVLGLADSLRHLLARISRSGRDDAKHTEAVRQVI